MGWTGSGDTQVQVQLKFPSKDAAQAYVEACREVGRDPNPRPTSKHCGVSWQARSKYKGRQYKGSPHYNFQH